MILVNRSFSIVTPESAARGDAHSCGLLLENEPLTFRELVAALRGGDPSCRPARGDPREWVGHDQGETRAFFERGERETQGIHFSRDNPAHRARYWRLAMIAAGHVRN